jgi:Fe-S oxidoreductase
MSAGTDTTPDEPTVADFAYPDFYRAMLEREHMQVTRDETTWCEQPEDPDRPVDVLLNFGCNVRQTPHLQREAVAVLKVLGVDFQAVAGQKFCCGKPYSNNGLDDVAKNVVQGSVRRMGAYRPKRALQWCSACEMQFRDVVVPQVGIEFRSEGFAAFLVERLDELGNAVPWVSDVRIEALVHGHFGEHAVRDSHPPIAMELLRRIPGVTVVGLAESATFSVCDNAGPKIANITTDEYRSVQAELEQYLTDSSADTLVTLYHGCTRELGKFASDRLSVRHYISVLAHALGVSKPDRFSEYWRLGDPEKVMEASRANWESWGISEEEALRLAHKHFVPSYASNVPDCPCHGECTRTGAAWLLPHAVGEQGAGRWRA